MEEFLKRLEMIEQLCDKYTDCADREELEEVYYYHMMDKFEELSYYELEELYKREFKNTETDGKS